MAIELLKRTALVALLLVFAAIGVRAMLDPERVVRRSGLSKGGDMLKTWNRDQIRVVGAIFVAAALYMLYHAVGD